VAHILFVSIHIHLRAKQVQCPLWATFLITNKLIHVSQCNVACEQYYICVYYTDCVFYSIVCTTTILKQCSTIRSNYYRSVNPETGNLISSTQNFLQNCCIFKLYTISCSSVKVTVMVKYTVLLKCTPCLSSRFSSGLLVRKR